MAGLRSYVIRRSIHVAITLFAVLTIIFILFELLPARPFDLITLSPNFKPAQKEALIELFGFNKPVHERYFTMLWNMFTFNFGLSFATGRPVSDLLQERVPPTLLLFGLAVLISYAIGILVGAVIAWRRGGVADGTTVLGSLVFFNMPSFWIGLIFIVLFAFLWRLFPLGGLYDPTVNLPYVLNILWHISLPLIVLVLLSLAGTILLMRTAMLDIMGENYIVTAKAKGLPEKKVLYGHAARNAMLPVVTAFVISFVFTISGGVVIEQVFSFPGVGKLYIDALNQLDFPVMMATLYVIALLVLIGNFVADLLYGVLDPRVRI